MVHMLSMYQSNTEYSWYSKSRSDESAQDAIFVWNPFYNNDYMYTVFNNENHNYDIWGCLYTIQYIWKLYFINISYRWSWDRPRPRRIDGRHGMVTMACHGPTRIGDRRAERSSWSTAAAQWLLHSGGQQSPKSKLPASTRRQARPHRQRPKNFFPL